jgi:hypothetical protein
MVGQACWCTLLVRRNVTKGTTSAGWSAVKADTVLLWWLLCFHDCLIYVRNILLSLCYLYVYCVAHFLTLPNKSSSLRDPAAQTTWRGYTQCRAPIIFSKWPTPHRVTTAWAQNTIWKSLRTFCLWQEQKHEEARNAWRIFWLVSFQQVTTPIIKCYGRVVSARCMTAWPGPCRRLHCAYGS